MAVYAFGKRVPKIDPSAWIFPSASVIGKVSIGANVYIGAGAVIRGDYGKIEIADGVSIEENVTIHARPGGKTVIEKNVTIGHAAMIHNCTLKHDCVIGMHATVSDYAVVGENAIVGEAALVKSKQIISPNIVAVGVPAKEIKEVPQNMLEFWHGVKEIYRDLAEKYPIKLKRIDDFPY
ncbi:MAG: gamma carbonic anhydrase family protein [Candidatus Lokiarchaeota archaeon]|nr:gamma carbonic anhydrase family protein [Candidatus Harpocratesius repetitus]